MELIKHLARRLVFNIAGVPRAPEVSSAGSFPPHPSLVTLVHSSLSSGMNPPQASAPRWEMGGQGVLCTHSRRGVRRSSGYPAQRPGQMPVLGVHLFCLSWVVLNGPCLPCNIVRPVYLRSWLSPSSFLSFRKCAVKFWTGTQKMRLLRGRPRSLSSSSPFSSSPWLVLTSTPLFARLLVAATRRTQERERRKHLCLSPPLLSAGAIFS